MLLDSQDWRKRTRHSSLQVRTSILQLPVNYQSLFYMEEDICVHLVFPVALQSLSENGKCWTILLQVLDVLNHYRIIKHFYLLQFERKTLRLMYVWWNISLASFCICFSFNVRNEYFIWNESNSRCLDMKSKYLHSIFQ